MKKSIEMRKKLSEIKNEIKQLQLAGKIQEAHDKLAELEVQNKAIEVQEMLEQDEAKAFVGREVEIDDGVNENVVFNKVVLNRAMNEKEREYAERVYNNTGLKTTPDENGGYLMPKTQIEEIKDVRRQLVSLKDYCTVYNVASQSGSMPVAPGSNDVLINFDDLNEITPSTVQFSNVVWNCKTVGDLIPVANNLLKDENVKLVDFVKRRFAKKAVRTENKDILALAATAEKVSGTSYKDIIKVLNTKLDPDISAISIIITNQSGFDYLDGLTDERGLPLLSQSLVDETKKKFKGREIVVMDDAALANPSGKNKFVFYVGALSEFAGFFDREGVELAVSEHAGFSKNATLMRVIERYDVKKVDDKALVNVELTIAG